MQTRKRLQLLTLIALATLLTIGVALGDSLSVSVGSAEGASGSKIAIPVSVTEARDLGAFQAELVFDQAVLELDGIDAGPLLDDALLDSHSGNPGRVKIGFVKLAGVNGSGVLFTLRFAVTGKDGASSSLELQEIGAWEQSSHSEIRVNAIPGNIVVRSGSLPLPLPMLIGAGVAVFLILVIVMCLSRRRKPDSRKSPQNIQPQLGEASAATSEYVFCTECGAKNSRTSKFCSECGNPIAPKP